MIELQLRFLPMGEATLSFSDRLTVLRGQLTLIRRRCEGEFPITEAVANAERIVRSLQLKEMVLLSESD